MIQCVLKLEETSFLYPATWAPHVFLSSTTHVLKLEQSKGNMSNLKDAPKHDIGDEELRCVELKQQAPAQDRCLDQKPSNSVSRRSCAGMSISQVVRVTVPQGSEHMRCACQQRDSMCQVAGLRGCAVCNITHALTCREATRIYSVVADAP